MSDAASDPFGLLDPRMRIDPYPTLARLREQAPVYFSEAHGCWLITRHDDASACFRDPRLSANRSSRYAATLPPQTRAMLAPLENNLARWALLMDPPDHTRIRGLISKSFTPKAIEQLGPRISELSEELLARVARLEEFDLISEFAYPLPVMVIGELLGLPREHADRLKHWSDAFGAFLGAVAMSPTIVGDALRAVVDLEAYFREQLEHRRAAPTDDLLTALLQAHEQDDRLSEQELLSTCTMLLFGGHETTTNLIGNGVLALLQHPDQLARLRQEPQRWATSTVEELLRFDSPVLRMGRVALEPIVLRGQTIAAGDRVFMMLAAANRDPEQFVDPDRLDISRVDNRHLSFGLGAHYCLGATLGRLEARLAIPRLFERFPNLRLPEIFRARWLDNLTVRGLEELPLLPA
jgi:cytochrome P450